jgi:glutamine amidotransferase
MSDNYIQILDYGIGNVRSLRNALDKIEINNIVNDKIDSDDRNLKGLIIPGVGAFPAAMDLLNQKKLIESIVNLKNKNIPILGICLGMQILFEVGNEIKKTNGLKFIKGDVIPLDNEKMTVPNIGWRSISGNNNLFKNLNNKKFYFVHSFFANPKNLDNVIYNTEYEKTKIPAIVKEKNIFGFQFHPEKSGEDGLILLKHFCKYSFGYNN